VFREDRIIIAVKCKVVTHKDTDLCGAEIYAEYGCGRGVGSHFESDFLRIILKPFPACIILSASLPPETHHFQTTWD